MHVRRRVRRRLETSARGLRAAQVLQDSNVLQIRVDGGAGALANSRAESTRSRQQVRELRARLLEVQSVMQRQALEVVALREKLPEDCVAELSDLIYQRSSNDCVAAEKRDPSMDTPCVVPTTENFLHYCTLSPGQDGEHSLDGDSCPVNVEPCSGEGGGGSRCQRDICGHQEVVDTVRSSSVAIAGTVVMREEYGLERRDESPEPFTEVLCEAATSAQDVAGGSETVYQSSQVAVAATPSRTTSAVLSHITSRGRPQSSGSFDSAKTNHRPPSCTKTTVIANPLLAEHPQKSTGAWLTQVAPFLPPPEHGCVQETYKHSTSPLSISAAERPCKAGNLAPVVVGRNAVGGAATPRRVLLESAHQVRSTYTRLDTAFELALFG